MNKVFSLFILFNFTAGETETECKANKCNPNSECVLNKAKKAVCACKLGYFGDGVTCTPKFTLVVELCKNEDGSLISNALRPIHSNTSMHLNFWLNDEVENYEYQQAIHYALPNVINDESTTVNYYDEIDIFHITKLKVLQDHWQKICLQRLSIHQGDAYIYILRTLDKLAYQPEWSNCTDTNDPKTCIVYTWWKKRCPTKKRSSNGEIDACRSRFLYKHDIEPNLFIRNKEECATGTHNCHKNASCLEADPGFRCVCNDGFIGNGEKCGRIKQIREEQIKEKDVNGEVGRVPQNDMIDAENKEAPKKEKSKDKPANSTKPNKQSKEERAPKERGECDAKKLPKNAVTVGYKFQENQNKPNGGVYRIKCTNGSITPTNPMDVSETTTYKAQCECDDLKCKWKLDPEFTCEPGCPFQHESRIHVIRSWSNDDDESYKTKLKIKFRPPSGRVDEWRVLLKFGTALSTSNIIRSRKSIILDQKENMLLLGNKDNNGLITADDGTFGFLLKLVNVTRSENNQFVKNMSANFVGSDVKKLDCFL